MSDSHNIHRAVILVARSAIAAAPVQEMAALALAVTATDGVDEATFAFTEQGSPDLRQVFHDLIERGAGHIVIIPLLVPMEPAFSIWLTKVIRRWESAAAPCLSWPDVRIGPAPKDCNLLAPLVSALIAQALAEPALTPPPTISPEGSAIPMQKHRVLICHGGPCNNAGASVIWGHFRNEQVRLKLRSERDGVMSAKTSCLGPCNLAPVIQIWPDGTYYGGVDEVGVDEIIESHLLGGTPVEHLSYAPSKGKQMLRRRQ